MTERLEALPLRHVLTLPAMGAAVRTARETTEQVLVEWGIGLNHPSVGPTLLILSELVTNSVRHAAVLSPNVTVLYAAGPDTFAFGVHDRHPYRPALHAPAVGAAGGGLATVTELTLALGGTAVVRDDADGLGKSIWITVPLR
ncbi:ATP-binding protein [Streptomyces sp. NPDC057496]|uniref:ATP-binding protein n=1 Tax=Streptomyces sp. NPDC057496 TaxID=3346149 RepID=UPI00368653EC